RGPQIEYFEDHVNTNFALTAQAFATDFLATGPNPGENNRDGLTIPGTVDGKKYTELAGVTVQAFVVCDMQGQGSYIYARNNSNVYNTADNEATFTFGANKLPNGASEGASAFWLSTPKGVSSSVADLLNPWITSGSSKTPRFCKVRYVFTETNWSTALPNLRKWQRHGAEMCTYTEINEGVPGLSGLL
ncbi:MAG: protease, partial [Bdellovibrio sp. CG10_big_fil_rev_8_21_14_0_10_47_8]